MTLKVISRTSTTAEVALIDADQRTSVTRHLQLKGGQWVDRFGSAYQLS